MQFPNCTDIFHGIGPHWYFCLKYVAITLYPSFQGPTSVPCFVDEELPLNGSLAGTAEDTGIEPAPVSPGTVFEAVTTSQYSTIFLAEKAPKWHFPSQLQTGVRPILHWVYTNARGLRVWTPEHAPQHPLCPCSRDRTCDLSPAIGGALPLSYTRDVSVG